MENWHADFSQEMKSPYFTFQLPVGSQLPPLPQLGFNRENKWETVSMVSIGTGKSAEWRWNIWKSYQISGFSLWIFFGIISAPSPRYYLKGRGINQGNQIKAVVTSGSRAAAPAFSYFWTERFFFILPPINFVPRGKFSVGWRRDFSPAYLWWWRWWKRKAAAFLLPHPSRAVVFLTWFLVRKRNNRKGVSQCKRERESEREETFLSSLPPDNLSSQKRNFRRL